MAQPNRPHDGDFIAHLSGKKEDNWPCWIQPGSQDLAVAGFAGASNPFKVKITVFVSHVCGPHISVNITMRIDRFVSEVSQQKEHHMYLRYDKHLRKPFQLHQVTSETRLPSVMIHDETTRALNAAGQLCMFSLSQHEPSDFELETPVIITGPFIGESLRTLKLVRTNPNITIYVRRFSNLAARLTEFVEVLRG